MFSRSKSVAVTVCLGLALTVLSNPATASRGAAQSGPVDRPWSSAGPAASSSIQTGPSDGLGRAMVAGGVSIGQFGDLVADATGVAGVTPVVKTAGAVEVKSTRMTVKRDGKTVVKDVKKADLAPGQYSVTTTVKFRTYKAKTTPAVVKSKVTVKAGAAVTVHCVADVVKKYNSSAAGVHATCASKKFDAELHLVSGCAKMKGGWSCREDPEAVFGFLKVPKQGKEFDASIVPWKALTRDKILTPEKIVKTYSKVKTKVAQRVLTVQPAPEPVLPTAEPVAPAE